jgi:uncharacterized protein YxeA
MKHVAAFILFVIVLILVSPIMLIKWNTDGMDTIVKGIEEMCGVN